MTPSTKRDDAVFVAAKWLAGCSLLVVVATVAIWVDMNDRPRSKARSSLGSSRQEDDERFDGSTRRQVAAPAPRAPRPRQQAVVTVEEEDAAAEATDDGEPTEAQLEAERYEQNDRNFEERLAQLEQELAEGRSQEETNRVLSERLTAFLGQTTKIPTTVETRCSESVCEISFAGEGSALDFATAAATGLSSVARGAARGSASQSTRDAFDPESAIQPNADRLPQPAGDDQDGLPPPAVALRSIRYLVSIDDLKLETETVADAPQ